MKKYIFLYFFLNAFFVFSMKEYNFKWLDAKTGLADNNINGILRDSYGFMWFATDNGISCYDGYRFNHYNISKIGESGNKIFDINEDAAGNIWIQSFDFLFYYNREKDKIDKNIQPILSKFNIYGKIEQLFVDHNHNLWCTTGKKLVFYNFEKKQKSTFSLLKDEKIIWLECRDNKAYILFSNGKIGKVNFEKKRIDSELFIRLSNNNHHKIYLDYSHNLWFYTAFSPDNSLQRYNTQTKTWHVLTDKKRHICEFISSVIDDGKGNIWVATGDAGVYIYHTDKDNFSRITYEKNDSFSLPTNHITCIYKDKQDIMWIGTSKRGIAYASLNNILITKDKKCELDDINCILEDKSGNIWIGSDGEGIIAINKLTKKSIHFSKNDGSIPIDLIVCSFLDSKSRIWFGTYGGGAFYYEKGKFVKLIVKDTKIANLIKEIRSINEDAAGNIWFGTIDKGLFCYDRTGNIKRYSIENSSLPTNSITDLYCNFGRNLYIATSSGLRIMNVYTHKLSYIQNNKKIEKETFNKLIKCIYLDSRNFLWIGGENGIQVLNSLQDSIFQITTENGISHNSIKGITEDNNNNIWITTNYGITNIVVVNDPMSKVPTFRCYPYYDKDGLGNITFNYHSIFCNHDGEILMGGIGGYIKAEPKLMQFNQSSSKVIFTALHVANNLIEVGESIKNGKIILLKNIQLTDEITLDYSHNTFSLDVSSMNYEPSCKTTFFYRLSDKEDWIKLDGNSIYFNALPPGTYNLQVRASYNEQYWLSEPSSILIHIKPPFWLSLWAFILYFLLFCFVFIFVLLNIQKRAKLKMQMHEMEINMTKHNEIDEAKMRFLTNISHDLRTPISLIITPLEKLLSSNISDSTIKEDLNLIHRNAKILMNVVSQLLELRQLDNEKSILNLSLGNLSEFIKEICDSFDCYSMKKRIKLEVVQKGHGIEMEFDKNKIQRIIMNLIDNAFKFNVENGSIVVTIDKILGTDGEMARIQIADEGIGIPDKNKAMIFERFYQEIHTSTYVGSGIGLHIVKEYIQMHKGKIEVKDNIPHGTIFVITLPITNTTEHSEEYEKDKEEDNNNDSKNEEYLTDYPILIVEDNDDFRQFLTSCLKKFFPIITAPNGKKALNLMAKQSVQLVISDIMMPVMNGYELCNAIKGDIRFSHIPIILLTARTSEDNILKGLKEGADDYISKPFNLEILLLRINKLIEWGKNNHIKFNAAEIKPSEITISSLDEQLISKSISLVEENMNNSNYSVEELSNDIGMSRGHFYKKLIAITGKSPKEFIITLRIKRGRQLLEKSQMNVSEIAYNVGLSPKQFTKYYKEIYFELPSEYKEKKMD